MHTFVSGSNNGITALITEGDYRRKLEGQTLEFGIFLFTPNEATHVEPWFHGTRAQMDALLADSPVQYEDLYIPFSNGAQLYAGLDSSGAVLIDQLEQLASWADIVKVFGPDAWQVYHDVPARALIV